MKILNIITNVEGKAASEAGKVSNLQGVVVGLSLKNLLRACTFGTAERWLLYKKFF